MEPFYKTPEDFDRALKKAIAGSGGDAGSLYWQMLRDRFLCRVFANGNNDLILKGGSGLLARIPDARTTRDIDFGRREDGKHGGGEFVLNVLNDAVSRDLGDWCRFVLAKCDESVDENGYSRLLRLRYRTFIGDREKDPILIDLSLDCETTLPPERLAPANRVQIEGIETSDYLVYPLPDQLADKFCAIMERQPGGWPSSRMKDLVDVVTYVTRENFQLGQLRYAIECECARRSMDVPAAFAAPQDWKPRFMTFAKKNNMPEKYANFDAATSLAADFYNPALSKEPIGNASWSPSALKWLQE